MSPNPHTTLEERILAAAPEELSAAEERALFEAVKARHMARPVASPFFPLLPNHTKFMIPIVLMLAVLFGAGGTVAASDSARPGDFLFPLDRAVEDFRLSLASNDDKQELRVKFANERLAEFDEIAGSDDLTGDLDEAEADIFTNETVVKLEAGDRTATFTTDADTRTEIIDVIHDRYGFSTSSIDAVLTVDTEDRESTADDRDEDEDRTKRLENALDVLGDFIEKNRDQASTSPSALAALALIENRLLNGSASLPREVRVKVENDRARYEVRGENGERVRVEVKDGEVRVKTSGGDDDDSDDDSSGHGSGHDDDEDDSDNRNRVGTSTSSGFLQVEADIFTDTTVVKVELSGRTTVFSTDADTRAEIIDEIQDRFSSLSESQIDAVLDLETEDRGSRAGDLEEDFSDDSDDDDSSDHHSDDDSDDDEDDHVSGHGSDDDDDDDDNDSSGKGSGKDDKDDDD